MRTVCLDGKPVQQSIDCTILARAVATNQMTGWKFDLYQGDTRMHGTQHFHGFTPAQPFLIYIRTYVYGIELHTHDVSLSMLYTLKTHRTATYRSMLYLSRPA